MPYTEEEIEQWKQVYEELKIQIAEVKLNHSKMTVEQRKEKNALYGRIRYNSLPEVRNRHREYYLKENPDAIEYKKNVKRPTRPNDTRAPYDRNTPIIRTRINNTQTIKKQIQTETIEQFKTTVGEDNQRYENVDSQNPRFHKPQIRMAHFGF